MTISGSSNVVCSHSHFWNPFCPHQTLLAKVTNVFLLGLGAVVGYIVYSHILRSFTTDLEETQGVLLSALKIPSENEISKLPEIVEVSLAILQDRAKPGGDTSRGFIKEGEFLLEVIKANWQKVRQAKITHAEIADHLHYLIQAAKASPRTPVPYDVLTRTSDPEKGPEEMPRFTVTFVKKEVFDTDIFRPENAEKEVGASKEEVLILNTAVQGKYIRWTPLRERYIREFGFYSLGMEFDTVLQVLRGRVKFYTIY